MGTLELFVVMYLGGLIGGVIGPIPASTTGRECQTLVAEIHASMNYSVITESGWTAKDVRFECEYHVTRPQLHPLAGKRRV